MLLSVKTAVLAVTAFANLAAAQHFFGPPAIGFGAGLVGYHRRLPVSTSIVSRRSSRSYSHQSFIQYTPHGTFGYRHSTYTATDHFYTPNNMAYYQPNKYHYHSTPWRYRWGRSADTEARTRRAARLSQLNSDIKAIPVNTISKIAANVSIAFQPEVWTNDMVFKDQDDCSKRLLCELNAKAADGSRLTETESIIAESYGKDNEIDVGAESLEFDLAAVVGREGGLRRCELSYRRCESSVTEMMRMIDLEVEELEMINNELDNGAVDFNDIENRLEEEDREVGSVTLEVLTRTTTTTTTTTTPRPTTTKKPGGSYWWIDTGKTQTGGKL